MSKEFKPHKSKIGGQALIEGVMMKGALKGAMACRLPDGSIDVETWDLKGAGKNKPWYRKIPLIRGCYSFIFSMADGYRCLMKSAEKQPGRPDAPGVLRKASAVHRELPRQRRPLPPSRRFRKIL
ncbi:MAG: hypothetical protein IKP69_09295, partial [Oscillospiraceae bacterium]|nr:hypothetical protein [Oscillospiraceae bacterium]